MQIEKRLISKVALHASLWVLFILLPALIIAPLVILCSEINAFNAYVMVVISSLLLVAVFYMNYLYLFPNYYIPQKRLKYIGLLAITIILSIIATKAIANKEITEQLINNNQWKRIVVAVELFRLLLVVLASSGLVMYEHWQKIEREKLKAEVSFLKAQINPHFLFNTLNGIYSLVLKKSNNAPGAVAKLSAIMQYAANDSVKDKIALDREINYIQDYIELQKLRLTDYTTINFLIEGSTSLYKIEPMLLISFIENAFKYGVSTEIRSSIDIKIIVKDQKLHLYVRNDKVRKQSRNNESGLGLENTIQRLKSVYDKMHVLKIDDLNSEYKVELILDL